MKTLRRWTVLGKIYFMLAVAAGSLACAEPEGGTRIFFGFNRSKPDELLAMQQRGYDAVQQVSARLEQAGFETHLLQSPVSGAKNPGSRSAPSVSCEMVCDRLKMWGSTLDTNGIIVIYSHTHGLKTDINRAGGILLGRSHPGNPLVLNWPDYAEQLLRLPAKTVVVLTMACHSGALVDYLNTDEKAKNLWQTRKESGRNFLVITSQNADSLSNPQRIDGEVINPFTCAVRQALEGNADGYREGGIRGQPDGRITLGELAAFIPAETRKHTRTGDESNDPDPQITGSFDPETVIAEFPQSKLPPRRKNES
jgi:hypothetical protein